MDIHVWNFQIRHYQEEYTVIWQLNSRDPCWVDAVEGWVQGLYDHFELNLSFIRAGLYPVMKTTDNYCIVPLYSAQRLTRITRFLAEPHAIFMTSENTAAFLCTGCSLMDSGITTLLFFFNLGTLWYLPIEGKFGKPRSFSLSINHSSLGETLAPWIIKYTVLESQTKYCHEWQ